MSRLIRFVSKYKLLHILVFMVVVAAAVITGSVTDISINDGDVTFGIRGTVYAITPDYTLDGTDDDVEIQAVLDGFPSGGGRIHLFAGDYQFHETVWRAIDNVTIIGAGACTVITTEGASDAPFDCTGQSGWVFANMSCDDAFGGTFGTTNFRSMCIIGGTEVNDIPNSTVSGPLTLAGSGLIYLRFRPVLDQDMIRKNTKPDVVYRGLVRGFSMPIYASDAEELFFTEPYCPARWDGASDIIVRVSGYLDTANDTKRFKLNLAWEHQTPGTDVITTSEHSDNVETLTGAWSQYQSFYKEFTIDYNVDGADVVTKGDVINMRLRRVAKAGAEAEIAGEVVITGVTMKYRCDKFGSSA